MIALRETPRFRELEQALAVFDGIDHEPEIDPDELIPRYWESRLTLAGLDYVREWDLPDDIADGLERLRVWLRDEHAAHARLIGMP